MKYLDKTAKEFILEGRKKKLTYTVLANQLTNLGYRSPTGKAISDSQVSVFMIREGHRTNNLSPNAINPILPKNRVTTVSSDKKSLITAIFNAGLSESQKIELLTALAK
jgi:hypothetical protein